MVFCIFVIDQLKLYVYVYLLFLRQYVQELCSQLVVSFYRFRYGEWIVYYYIVDFKFEIYMYKDMLFGQCLLIISENIYLYVNIIYIFGKQFYRCFC